MVRALAMLESRYYLERFTLPRHEKKVHDLAAALWQAGREAPEGSGV